VRYRGEKLGVTIVASVSGRAPLLPLDCHGCLGAKGAQN